MNIQIFGNKKSSDTRKAERWFKERRIKAQLIDLNEKPMSKNELRSVVQAAGGLENVLDPDCKDQDALALVRYISPSQQEEALLENQQVLRLPVVRNGKKAAVGYRPDTYEAWMKEEAAK